MTDYITKLTGAIMEGLKKHGSIKAAITLIILASFIAVMALAWQLPEIILAIKS